MAKKLQLQVLVEKNKAALSAGKSVTGVKGHWTVHLNLDMPGDGDIETIQDWRKTKTLEDLKAMVEKKNYSAITIGNFPDAYLKRFFYQLKPNNA